MKHLLLCLLFVACGSPEGAIPVDVLPREKFTTVLLEAQLIEARMNHELVVAHHSTIPSEQYYRDMFKAQGTDDEEFKRSFRYWSSRPEDMKVIYETIITELTRRKDERP